MYCRSTSDEKVARLHLAKIGVELDELTEAQSSYLGITKEGPFKPDLFNHLYHHRGELVVYLRAAGAQVPGLYGPTYEDRQRAADKKQS
jgi:acyl CoA:acetate/3-ketoacid CoA transferase alpha subunit